MRVSPWLFLRIWFALAAALTGACAEPDAGRVGASDVVANDTPAGALVCPAGASAEDGACVPPAAACEPRLVRAPLSQGPRLPASAPRAIAIDGGLVAVASAIGLELYPSEVAATAPPAPLAEVALDGLGLDVALTGGIAAVAHGPDGVTLVDVRDPTRPAILAHVPAFDSASGVALAGTRLVVADGAAGVSVWDVSPGQAPELRARIPLAARAETVALAGDLVYVAAHQLGLVVIALDAPAPTIRATLPIDGGDAQRVRLARGQVWVAAGYAGVHAFDLAEPATPTPAAEYRRPDNMILATDLAVDEAQGLLYIADFWHRATIVDLAAPAVPSWLPSNAPSAYTHGLAVAKGRAWLAGDALAIFDVTARPPVLLHTLGGDAADAVPAAIAADELGTLYVAERPGALAILAVAPDGSLAERARYVTTSAVSAVAAHGGYAYLARDTTESCVQTAELEVVDVRGAPSLVGSLALSGAVYDLSAVGDGLLYVAAAGRILFIDVSDPAHPTQVGALTPAGGAASRIDRSGDLLVLGLDTRGLALYDVHDRRAPVPLGALATWTYGSSVALVGKTLYAADRSAVRAFDVSDPTAPRALGTLELADRVVDLTAGPTASGDVVWALAGGEILALDARAAFMPLGAAASPGRDPRFAFAADGLALIGDAHEPVAPVTITCTPVQATYAAPGVPTDGVQWVDLAVGADSIRVDLPEDASPALGYAQGTPPIAAGPSELVVATGDARAPALVRAPRQGPPDARSVRVRAVQASPTDTLQARLHVAAPGAALAPVWPLAADAREPSQWDFGALPFGAHSVSYDLRPSARYDLWLSDGSDGLAGHLPALAASHAYDLILARGPDGELFALLQRDDGLTQQVGSAQHASRVRIANLTREPLDVALEDQPVAAFANLAPLTSSAIATVWPGSAHLTARRSDTGELRFDAPVVPLAIGDQLTYVLAEDANGVVSGRALVDFSGQQTQSGTELQLVQAAPDLGPLDATLVAVDQGGRDGAHTPFATDLAFGAVSAPRFPATGTYDLALDLDRDGTSDHRFPVGYFPDYGFNLFIARDLDGHLRVGTQSPVDQPIGWTYARDELATVRVMNLTGLPATTAHLDPWYGPADTTVPLAAEASTYHFVLRAGHASVRLVDDASGAVWTWQGALAGGSASTIVFWKTAAGAVQSLVVADNPPALDGPLPDASLRFVDLDARAAAPSPVTAWVASAPDAPATLLGTVAPGEATAAESVGAAGALSGAWVRVQAGDQTLSFALGTSGVWYGTANVFLVADATWPYLVVQGPESATAALYAEELQTRLRIVYLPLGATHLTLQLDAAAPFDLAARPAVGGPGPKAYAAGSDLFPLLGGEHTLRVTPDPASGGAPTEHPLTLASGGRSLLLIYGDAANPTLTLLDDAPGDPTTTTASAYNAGAVPVGIATRGPHADAGWTPLVASLAPGSATEPIAIDGASADFGVDWSGDGVVDWTPYAGASKGHLWLIATPSATNEPLLLVVSGTASIFLGGRSLP